MLRTYLLRTYLSVLIGGQSMLLPFSLPVILSPRGNLLEQALLRIWQRAMEMMDMPLVDRFERPLP